MAKYKIGVAIAEIIIDVQVEAKSRKQAFELAESKALKMNDTEGMRRNFERITGMEIRSIEKIRKP